VHEPDKHGSLNGDLWVPAFKEQYVLMEGAAAVASKAEQDVVFELKGDFAIHGFQARHLHCLESEPGTFTIVSQTVGGRPQRVLTAEVPAIMMTSKDHQISFRLHFCKPGEKIVVRVRNDGPTPGDIRMGIVGDMWRPREPRDDAKTQRNQRKT